MTDNIRCHKYIDPDDTVREWIKNTEAQGRAAFENDSTEKDFSYGRTSQDTSGTNRTHQD